MPAVTTAKRKIIRLHAYDYTSSGAYFVTICTYKRESLFGTILEDAMQNNDIGDIILETWNAIPEHFPRVTIDAFVVMPNHVHGIVWIHDEHNESSITVGARHASPLRQQRDDLKSAQKELAISRDRAILEIIPGVRSSSLGAIVGSFKSAVTKNTRIHLNNPHLMVWQRNYYEHVIRNEHELNAIRQYIIENPCNWSRDRDVNSDLELHQSALAVLT